MIPSKYPIPNPRRNYLLYFEVGLILSLSTIISLFNFSFPEYSTSSTMWDIAEKEILQLETVIATTQPAPKPPAPPEVFVPNPPPEDKIVEEEIQNLDIEFSPDEPIPLPTDNFQKMSYLKAQQENPKLIGGIEKLQRNMEYPPEAIENNIEGRVIVKFLIDEKGKVHNPEIVKGVRYDLNREAIQAVSRAQFVPARQRGKPIAVEQIIFILFKID